MLTWPVGTATIVELKRDGAFLDEHARVEIARMKFTVLVSLDAPSRNSWLGR